MNTDLWIILIAFGVFLFGVLCYYIGRRDRNLKIQEIEDRGYCNGHVDGQASILKDPYQIKLAYDYHFGKRP